LDCVAHEYGHGIEHLNPGLGYTTIERALKEGLSDIWGAVLEYNIASEKVHWKIGEEIMDNGKDCLRNIAYPKASTAHTKMADTYNGQYYDGTYYQKSGVFSHWFYLLSDGGSGTNDLSNDYTVYGIGIDCATEIIFEAEIDHFDGVDSYPEARTATIDAAEELYGTNSIEVMQVKNAWYAVGVGTEPDQISISGESIVCSSPNETFILHDRPSGTTVNWTKSSNLAYVSGQGTDNYTVKAQPSASGSGWVQANISTGNCDDVTIRKDIDWVGVAAQVNPETIEFTCAEGEGYFCTNAFGNEFSFSYSQDYNYFNVKLTNWSETQTLCQFTIYSTEGEVDLCFPPAGTYKFWIRGNNDCGTGNWSKTAVDYVVCSPWGLYIFPNPTTGETTISIVSSNDKTSILNDDEEWHLQVYTQSKLLKLTKRNIKGNKYIINTSGWQTGAYFVQVYYKDEIITETLIVE
jgi:bacillolysin